MADWAAIMAALTLATFIATAVGVWLVKRTLDATLEAVVDTGRATEAMLVQNKIALAAQRPWIAIDCELANFSLKGRVLEVEWVVSLKNIGQSAAHNLKTAAHFASMGQDFPKDIDCRFNKFQTNTEVRESVLVPGQVYTWAGEANESFEHLPWEMREGYRKDCFLCVMAMAKFRIGDDPAWHFAMAAFSIGENIGIIDNRSYRFDNPDLKPSDMIVQRFGRSRAT